ncbi:hypothetical protein F0562_035745 [Nyssa sinensis]|uniref:Uncharacterized protein n=1 Tax=Nyssa sinensis TaxID=561372 RepID=A0A5J5ACP1_9ASTE|nr:hypothetical protein F0562_035745 [Nyssa sinensis]
MNFWQNMQKWHEKPLQAFFDTQHEFSYKFFSLNVKSKRNNECCITLRIGHGHCENNERDSCSVCGGSAVVASALLPPFAITTKYINTN